MNEPSVLDYVKSKLLPWKYGPLVLPPGTLEADPGKIAGPPEIAPPEGAEIVQTRARRILWPWHGLAALALALIAQISLEPQPDREWKISAGLYALAAAGWVAASLAGKWRLAPPRAQEPAGVGALILRPMLLALAFPLALAAFLAFGGNLFTSFNLFLWLLAIACLAGAFWDGYPDLVALWTGLRTRLDQPVWHFSISRWSLAVLAAFALAAFFHLYRLGSVPPEMNSDHAEKLMDVMDVLRGETRIFFERNTGREFIQFYLTAAVIRVFQTGITFMSLKIGTAIAALFTLVYIYKLGKEVANREVGLWAVAFAGVAYWPNVISRIALRFSLYPLFVAPTLFYLLRGIRRSNRNDFILAGISLGLGLHGYSTFRMVPFIVVIAVGLYLLHRQSKGERKQTILRLGLLALVSLFVFLPLLRFALENPDLFAYRAFTRLSDWERPLPGPAWQIFISNWWRAATMFFWDDGEIWLHSIPHRPALSVVAAALYFMGVVLLLVRYLRQRHWQDLFLLVSVPLLMLPSILSLAFPGENPSLNRTAGAYVPVFIILGYGVESLTQALRRSASTANGASADLALAHPTNSGVRLGWAVALVLLAWSAMQDYNLVFDQYFSRYSLSSWNSSEMGQVIHDFAETVGSSDSAWVMSYPYWVDTRLVGMTAGFPTKNYEMIIDRLPLTIDQPEPKLFLLKPEDTEGLFALNQMYPDGWTTEYQSAVETKNFLIYFVPAEN